MHPVPVDLGRRPDLHVELDMLGDPGLRAGRVLAQHRGRWVVATHGAEGPPCLMPARSRLRANPPVTGDWVAVDAAGRITAVLARQGAIVRRAPGETVAEQVLAANVDVALILEPLPEPNRRRIERMVALASSGDVPACLVLTKADLDDDAHRVAAGLARRVGLIDAVAVSAIAAEGVRMLGATLEPGRTAVLLGASGAGKSTLVNALLGEQRQRTQAVRPGDRRGRHTTVTRELISLPGGSLLIDTPGVREIGVWNGSGDAFADVDVLAVDCRFADCGHDTEPGCAVRDAVEPDRIRAWRKLVREQAWIDDRKAAARERERLGRSYRSVHRESRRRKGDWN